MSPKEVSEKSPPLIMRRHVGVFFLAKADKTLCPISSHILISWIVLSPKQIWTSVCIETWEVVLQACPTSKTYFDEKGKLQPNSCSFSNRQYQTDNKFELTAMLKTCFEVIRN